MDIGKRFKTYRLKRGYSQKEAADLIGVKSYQLANYETGRSEPSIQILKKMSKAYRVSIDKLVGNFGYSSKAEEKKEDKIAHEDFEKKILDLLSAYQDLKD